jgi:hypothetical protein
MDSHTLGNRRPNGPKLNAADQRAVEMLLEQLNRSSTARGFATLTDPVDPARLEAVRKLLSVLDAYEVEEPPADLTARTLARVTGAPRPPATPTLDDRPTADA